jgi:hypothetical protein
MIFPAAQPATSPIMIHHKKFMSFSFSIFWDAAQNVGFVPYPVAARKNAVQFRRGFIPFQSMFGYSGFLLF